MGSCFDFYNLQFSHIIVDLEANEKTPSDPAYTNEFNDTFKTLIIYKRSNAMPGPF